ncbi:MAG: hypothetical protein GY757_34055 [bacterium]|nr:hypothetical protein [bacterium]
MKKLILVFTLVLFVAVFVSADTYVKQNVHTDAFEMMGQKKPAEDKISEQWIGKDKFAQVTAQQTMIIDLGQKTMKMLNHMSKTYLELSLPIDMSKVLPDQLAQMLSAMKVSITVTASGENKKIGDWNCQGYDTVIEMSGMMPMKIKMKSWATTDVPFDWKAYSEKMLPEVTKGMMAQMKIDDSFLTEMKKIKGYQVASEMTMAVMGINMNMTTKVVEISEKPAPAGIYTAPAGYTKKDKMSMGDMGR